MRNLKTPCLEHHIRIVTTHFLRHGGWRPLWLCDIAALSSHINRTFDWNLCLGEDKVKAEWTMVSMLLANKMVGIKSTYFPRRIVDQQIPQWLEAEIYSEWRQFDISSIRRPKLNQIEGFGSKFREIIYRWPKPLIALTIMNKSLNLKPVLLYQLICYLKKSWKYLTKY